MKASRRYVQIILLLFLLVGAEGCASWGTGIRIENLERPLQEIQKAVAQSLPLGQRRIESGGMEFYSQYFLTRGRKFVPAQTAPRRLFAHVYILGDRRPYVVEVYVKKERRVSPNSNAYAEDGLDQGLAKVIQQRIQQQLTKRREELNIIDDFRIF